MLPLLTLSAAAGLAALIGFAATRPNTFRITRATTINAAPEAIFPLIADFHRWVDWSPYEQLDPAMRKTYSGAESGVGAVYAWEGNAKAGEGCMAITGMEPPTAITIDLAFDKPFKARNVTTFTLVPRGEATEVSWSMAGPAPFFNKLMGIFMDMDALVGRDFEKGLARLKAIAER